MVCFQLEKGPVFVRQSSENTVFLIGSTNVNLDSEERQRNTWIESIALSVCQNKRAKFFIPEQFHQNMETLNPFSEKNFQSIGGDV